VLESTKFLNLNLLFIIPARGGSKGIPRKNLRNLGGKPLLYYSISTAQKVNHNKSIYVSSEDEEILNLASKYQAKIQKRDPMLSKDETTLDEVIFNAYQAICKNENSVFDFIITLQPTSPLLSTKSLEAAIQRMIDKPSIDTMISAVEDTHLSWSKVDGEFIPNYIERVNRQYLKPTYKETGGFLITRPSIISARGRIGNTIDLFTLDATEAIDIDTFEDWSICEFYLKRKKILFLVSGYREIGLGHIYNTLVIANEILAHEILFFCDAKSQMGFEKIKQFNYPVFIQKGDNLQKEVLQHAPDVIISDRLDTKKEDIQHFLQAEIPLIHFEDLGEGSKYADLVFNAIYPEEKKLKNHFFGAEYFCARDEFILSEQKEIHKNVKSILLVFGGVDPNNLTQKVLDAIGLYCLENSISIKVVTGFGYQQSDSLKKFKNITVHQNVKDISTYMLKADVVFTSAGRTTYELALLGVPSIVLAQNDREMTHFFASEKFGFLNLGIGVQVEASTILNGLKKMMNYEFRVKMQKKMTQKDLKSGKKKVVSIIKNFIDQL